MTSLADTLEKHHLTQLELNIPMSFELCTEFADKLTEWEPLAPRLDLDHAEIATIKHDNPQNLRSQCSACLTKWQNKFGSQATFLKLAQALKSIDRVEKLIEIFKTKPPQIERDLSSEIVPVASGEHNRDCTE